MQPTLVVYQHAPNVERRAQKKQTNRTIYSREMNDESKDYHKSEAH